MSKNPNHPALTADQACRIALGAFYNASSSHPKDGPSMVGAWMLELSRKLGEDDITGPHYREIIARWALEDNPPQSEQFAISETRANNGGTVGAR